MFDIKIYFREMTTEKSIAELAESAAEEQQRLALWFRPAQSHRHNRMVAASIFGSPAFEKREGAVEDWGARLAPTFIGSPPRTFRRGDGESARDGLLVGREHITVKILLSSKHG